MLIYKKYILKILLPPLAMVTVLVTSLVWITQILRMIHFIDKGIPFNHFLELVILLIPSLLFMILPIITVLAIIYVYNRLQDERQLIVLRSSGVSNYDLAKPALLIASIITIIAYYISMHLMPLSYNKMKQRISNFRENYTYNIVSARTFTQISKDFNIYVDNKNLDGSFDDVILFDNKIPDNRTIIFGKTGKITISNSDKTAFEFVDGVRHSYDKVGNLTKLYFDKLSVMITNETNKNISRNRTSLELYIHEMIWPDSTLTLDKQQRLITDGHSRIIWPLFNFAFVFLAISLFLDQPYSRKARVKPFFITFIPILLVAYFHFTLQKMAYKDLNYIFLCYANVFFCIIFSLWQSTRKSL